MTLHRKQNPLPTSVVSFLFFLFCAFAVSPFFFCVYVKEASKQIICPGCNPSCTHLKKKKTKMLIIKSGNVLLDENGKRKPLVSETGKKEI